MLLMCLPFVIYSAGMQMFFDSWGSPLPVPVRERESRAGDDCREA